MRNSILILFLAFNGANFSTPSSVNAKEIWPLKECKVSCNTNYVLICRGGQQFCVKPVGYSKDGDICGCCNNCAPTSEPARKPTPKPSPPSTSQPILKPTRKPIRPKPVPRPRKPIWPIYIMHRPTRKPYSKISLKPTPKPGSDDPTDICEDFSCRSPVFCGVPGKVPPLPFLPLCACDRDTEDNPFCWQNMLCKDLVQNVCTSSSECPSTFRCVPDGTCCGTGKSYCMKECYSSGAPYTWSRTTSLVNGDIDSIIRCNTTSIGYCSIGNI
jgi:hypothetical protein